MQHAGKDLVSYRQDTVDLAAGEWRVEEKSELDVAFPVANLLAQHGG